MGRLALAHGEVCRWGLTIAVKDEQEGPRCPSAALFPNRGPGW